MFPLRYLHHGVTDESLRVAILVGLLSVPITVALSWEPVADDATTIGGSISGEALLLAGLFVSYYYHDRADRNETRRDLDRARWFDRNGARVRCHLDHGSRVHVLAVVGGNRPSDGGLRRIRRRIYPPPHDACRDGGRLGADAIRAGPPNGRAGTGNRRVELVARYRRLRDTGTGRARLPVRYRPWLGFPPGYGQYAFLTVLWLATAIYLVNRRRCRSSGPQHSNAA